PEQGPPYDRCIETQTKRAKECNRKKPDQREACLAEVQSGKTRCSELKGATEASIFCSGTCQTTKCTAQRPCTIKPPGGK
ncbi:MAG: hypothetical protein GWN11_10025, partial [Candidatus Dadabacteria bacterium]|nr:hypothetical protein [Candidatus Dadabacteria bacterium]NIX16190.1 hypothetical protein [Candidatus Dadabacteria bacterium]